MFQRERRPWWPDVVVLTLISIMAAWVVNVARPQPLPWYEDFKAAKVQEAARTGLEVLSPAQAQAALEARAKTFVDAREPDEFAEGHIPGAVNIPAEVLLTGLEAAAGQFAKDAPLLFYCGGISCPKSKELAEGFKQLGYTALSVMPEGLEGWTASGGKVEGGK